MMRVFIAYPPVAMSIISRNLMFTVLIPAADSCNACNTNLADEAGAG